MFIVASWHTQPTPVDDWCGDGKKMEIDKTDDEKGRRWRHKTDGKKMEIDKTDGETGRWREIRQTVRRKKDIDR